MATAYKYQERDLDSQVNYADVGLGISNLITDQLATRKAKKEAYDDQVREYEKYAKQFPMGGDVGVNSWTSAYSTDMTQKTLEQYRAFKNGQVSEREHVEYMANMKNSTESMFNASQVFQDAYALKIERMNSADPNKRSQGLEPWLMEQNENYLNYADTKPVIDKYGQVQLMRKDKGGSIEYLTPEQLNNRSKAEYNYFNSDAELTRMEVGLGDEMIQTLKAATVGKVGSVQDIQDKAVKEGFDKAVDDYINSLDAPINISSVLTNDIGGAYVNNFTYSIDEANSDPNKILLKVPKGREGNPEPDFASTENGKKQEIAAKEWLKRQLIEKLDKKIGIEQTGAVGYAPQQQEWQYLASRGGREEKEYTKNMTNNLAKLYGGTEAEINAVTPYLRDYDKTIKSVSRVNGKLVVERFDVNKDGVILKDKSSSKEYPFKTKNKKGKYEPIPFNDWLQGAALGLAGISDVNDAINSTSQNYKSFKNYEDKDEAGKIISKEFRSDVIQKKKDDGTSNTGKGSTAKAGIN
jgi:hypothetical protein